MASEPENYYRASEPVAAPPDKLASAFAPLAGALSLVRRSKFASDAGALLLLNLLSKGVLFFGNAYMAKSLGATKLGISGLVLGTAQQVALVYNGGFDMVAVREIAVDRSRCHSIVKPITAFRVWVAFAVGLIWAATCLLTKSGAELRVWLLGVPILLLFASNLTFTFQAVEKLPLQIAINAGGSLLMSAVYFLYFRPGMPLGSDLVVYVGVGLATLLVSHLAYHRLNAAWAFGSFDAKYLVKLLRESWRYWLWAIFVFHYSVFQVPLISYMLGPREAGLYRIAFMAATGVGLMFDSVTSLLLPRLAVWQAANPVVMWRKQLQLLKLFLWVGAPPVAILLLVSKYVLHLLLGPEFDRSWLPFQILLVGRFVVFLAQIYSFGMAASKQDSLFLWIMAGSCAFSLSANLVFLRSFGLVGAATVNVATESLIFLLSFLCNMRFVKRQQRFPKLAAS